MPAEATSLAATYPHGVTIGLDRGIAERSHRRQADREAVFRAELTGGETVIARGAVVVTDQRVLFAWDDGFGWRSDAIRFDEVRSWALGRLHDERPIVRLDHPTHLRKERVPAHQLLRFAWGNAEVEVPHDDVAITFGSRRELPFRALVERLQQLDVPQGEEFVVAPPGTREERMSRSRAYLRSRM